MRAFDPNEFPDGGRRVSAPYIGPFLVGLFLGALLMQIVVANL